MSLEGFNMGRVYIEMGGPTKKIFDTASSKYWYFEMHRFCGPMLTDRHGDPLKHEPLDAGRFWEIVSWWAQQGEKMIEDVCVWEKPKVENMRHLGGNNYELIVK